MNVSLLEECTVGKLYEPGVVSTYLRHLPAASNLQTLWCSSLESSVDIETMLQTLPLLLHVKHVWLSSINLGESSLMLSPQMVNIERVYLWNMTMSCKALDDLLCIVNKLQLSVTVWIRGCDIKPETEFEQIKNNIKTSELFMVINDDIYQNRDYIFAFKTIKLNAK